MAGLEVGRRVESRIAPNASKERSLYESQAQALSRPGSESYIQEIAGVRNLVATFFPKKIDRQVVEPLAPTPPELFKHFRRQALFSDHNIPHLTIVAALSALDATRRLEGKDVSAEKIQKDQKRAWIIGMLHDVRRGGDMGGSLLTPVHGWTAAWKAPELMEHLGVEDTMVDSRREVGRIRHALRHHDVDWAGERRQSVDLHTIKLADRAAIGRLFESQHAVVRATAGVLASRRMRKYPTHDAREEVPQEYMDGMIRIAGAVDILTRQNIRALQAKGQLTAESAYQATLDILEDLGVFSLQTTGIQSAA